MYSVESYYLFYYFFKYFFFLQKKRIGKEKNQSYCKHTQRYKHCRKKQWNVTWVYSIKILTWLQEADNDSCGWYVTKKKKLSFLYPVVLQVVCFLEVKSYNAVKTMCVSTNMRSQRLNTFATEKQGKETNVSKRMQRWWKEKQTDLDQRATANTCVFFANKCNKKYVS